MTQKARLSALVGLLAFFIACPCYAIKPGLNNCSGTCIYWQVTVSDYNPSYTQCNTYSGSAWPLDGSACVPTTGTYSSTGCGVLQVIFTQKKWSTSVSPAGWISSGSSVSRYVRKNVTAGVSSPPANLSAEAAYPTGPPASCADGFCDASDDDGDGVCNSCDKTAGAPDPKDCVYLTSRNAAGQVVDMMIDEGCKGTAGDNRSGSVRSGSFFFF